MNVNYTKNNEPFIGWRSEEEGWYCHRFINLDQFLYDLDEQIMELKDQRDYESSLEYNSDEGPWIIAGLEGQIASLEDIRTQFDGF